MRRPSLVEAVFPGVDASRGIGAFRNWPTRLELDAVREHARITGFPEDNPKLCLGPPDLDDEHHDVGPLEVPRLKRPDGKFVWCSLCQTWKFVDGRLMFTPSEGALRPIGHDCAREHFGEQRHREMRIRHAHNEKIYRSEMYLIESLPKAVVRARELAKYQSTASLLEKTHTKLFREVPRLGKALYEAAKEHGGGLAIARMRRNSAGGPVGIRTTGGTSTYELSNVGTVGGSRFLVRSFKISDELEDAIMKLREIPFATTQEESLEIVTELDDNQKENLASRLERLLRLTDRIEEKLSNASQFLSSESIRVIAEWLSDPDCPCDTKLQFDGRHLVVRERDGVSVVLQPLPGT